MTTLTKEQLEVELQRAYRCIQGLHTSFLKGSSFSESYHALTLGAAKRFVYKGELDGSVYFEGKHVSVLHDALKLSTLLPHQQTSTVVDKSDSVVVVPSGFGKTNPT